MRRINRVNELLKREISQLLLKEVDFPKDALVTVTRIRTSADLNQANIYISALPENKLPLIMRILNRKTYDIQKKINQKLKMKFIPKIRFLEEKETAKAGEIEKILQQIHNSQ